MDEVPGGANQGNGCSCLLAERREAVRKSGVLAVLVLGLGLVVSGVARPQRAAAYGAADVDEPVHEYMVDAASWLGADPEIIAHLNRIREGTAHEDVFDHIYDRADACVTITHFWEPDAGSVSKNTTVFCEEWNAWMKARQLWGMALGEYYSGDYEAAYEYLGHVAHLLSDMTVPAHAHADSHVYPDEFDDNFMTAAMAQLSESEIAALQAKGPVVIPDGVPELYYLFYTTAQVGDFYASDDVDGDTDDPEQWVDFSQLTPDDCTDAGSPEEGDCNLEVIRTNAYFLGIRAVASLYDLFEKTVRKQSELTVVIDSVQQIDGHGALDDPDYFVNIGINDVWFTNEGSQIEVDGDYPYDAINPGWAFARNAGLTGTASIKIELWDDDDDGDADCPSDIFTDPDEERNVWLTVDLATGAISGDLTGTTEAQLFSEGDDTDRSRIWFRIILPNQPPVAEAGPAQTVHESDTVTLSGSFTDPNTDDTHTVLWHLESSTNDQAVPDSTSQSLSFTPIDDGVYTFSFTVTDNHGAQGSDTVIVTAENVAPVAAIDSVTDETGARIGVDVPVALVGLVVGLAGSFTDVGVVDTHTAVINWGDATADPAFDSFSDCVGGVTGALSATHVYGVPGIYTISLSVTDDDAGVGATTFQIEVVDAAGAIASVVESLAPLADDKNIQAALDKLQGGQGGDASNGALDKLEQGNLNAALEKIVQALQYLEAAEAADPGLDLTFDKGLLALAGKSVAVGAVAKAEAVAFGQNELLKILQAKGLVAQGDALLGAQQSAGAVSRYQQAVRLVTNIK
jgi:PKD repeat protein